MAGATGGHAASTGRAFTALSSGKSNNCLARFFTLFSPSGDAFYSMSPNADLGIGGQRKRHFLMRMTFPPTAEWRAKMPLKRHARQPVEKRGSVLSQTA
jgi:hypothetical protein